MIFSAIGDPLSFKNILIENNFDVSKELIFGDHYNYSNKDIEKIQNIAKKNNLKIITTEKDYVKIPDRFKNNINYLSINLSIQNESELIELLEKI